MGHGQQLIKLGRAQASMSPRPGPGFSYKPDHPHAGYLLGCDNFCTKRHFHQLEGPRARESQVRTIEKTHPEQQHYPQTEVPLRPAMACDTIVTTGVLQGLHRGLGSRGTVWAGRGDTCAG